MSMRGGPPIASPRLSWFGDGRSCNARVIRRSCPRSRVLFQQLVVSGIDPSDPGGGARHDLRWQPLRDQHVGMVLVHQPTVGDADLVERGAGGDTEDRMRVVLGRRAGMSRTNTRVIRR